MSGKTADKGKKGVIILVAVCIVVIIALVGVIVALLLGQKKDEAAAEPKRAVLANEENVEQIVEELVEQEKPQVAQGAYIVTMNSDWEFPDGESASTNAYVENFAANTNDVYFDVLLADTEEVIYQSPVIPRGEFLNNIVLSKDLDAGTYDCVLIYYLVDEEQNPISNLRVTVTITVKA